MVGRRLQLTRDGKHPMRRRARSCRTRSRPIDSVVEGRDLQLVDERCPVPAMQKCTKKPIMLLYRAPVWARDPAHVCGGDEFCIYPPLPNYTRLEGLSRPSPLSEREGIEIWNEPKSDLCPPRPSHPYRLLKAAYDGVRARAQLGADGGLYPAGTTGGNVSARSSWARSTRPPAPVLRGDRLTSLRSPDRLQDVDPARRPEGPRSVRRWRHPPVDHRGRDLIEGPTSGVGLDQQGDVLAQLYRSIEGHDITPCHPSVLRRRLRLGSVRGAQSGPDAEAGLLRARPGRSGLPVRKSQSTPEEVTGPTVS